MISDFVSTRLSVVDIGKDILVGRPHGGTAILHCKCLAEKVCVVDGHNSRITSIQIVTMMGTMLLLHVYMLTNYNDDASLEAYLDCVSQLYTFSLHILMPFILLLLKILIEA